MIKYLFLFSILFIPLGHSMERITLNYGGEARSYLIYIPDVKKDSYDLMIGLHGYSGSATGFEKETTGGFNLYAEEQGIIVVYPQGSYFYQSIESGSNEMNPGISEYYVSSWNHLTSLYELNQDIKICDDNADLSPIYSNCSNQDACHWTSCSDDLGFIKDIVIHMKNTFSINKTYVMGLSNGGMMAQMAGCKYPDLFNGVLNVVGMHPLGLSCTPEKPTNLVIYGGMLDKSTPPVNITSSGGYFYEPILLTASSWSSKFNCKDKKSTSIDTIFQTKETVFYNCDNNVTITAILNLNSGHSWPGLSPGEGYCRSDLQSDIIYPECRDINKINGSKYLLDRLFSY